MSFKLDHKLYKKIYQFNSKCGIQKLINLIPDAAYLKLIYQLQLGKKLDLSHPVTFNEKLQWLKLYDRNPEYTDLVDKLKVRNYVSSVIGENYLIPLLGVWDSAEEIIWDDLPNRFVLKCTHDSGGIIVCTNKRELNIHMAKRKLKPLLKNNYYDYLREWPYRNIKPRIIAEKFITDGSGGNGNQLQDYKFFCFDGVPKLLMIVKDRFNIPKSNFYDMDFNQIDLRIGNPNFTEIVNKPVNFEEMIGVARKLSAGLQHVRVDLYNIDGKIYFGELTFFHWGGISVIDPIEWDKKLGDWLLLDDTVV